MCKKDEIKSQISAILAEFLDNENAEHAAIAAKERSSYPEMLTIKECFDLVPGLSEYSIRKLVKQGKVKYIRAGEGNNGKILVNKNSLIDYLNK